MVELFVQCVLRVGDAELSGLFGDTAAYYGTVEQQGQLMLHLHMIIWLCTSLSPQQVRERLLGDDSEFHTELIAYLESVHKGEYFNGQQQDVSQSRHAASLEPGYVEFTDVLPTGPEQHCDEVGCADCLRRDSSTTWWEYFRRMVDAIVNKCNIHSCLDNRWKKCKARFPRKLVEESNVDPETGHLNIKKREAWINTFAPLISYVFRCNTDVTSLRSGTAIKAVLIYVTDYITKPGLKTHAIFDCIRSIYQRNRDEPGDPNKTRKDRARKLMTQMVNVLGAKTELGSPMICTYLLGLPDHYTNRTFVTFYWKSFVSEVLNCWKGDDDLIDSVKVAQV
ncbi:hypothetical protein ARMSODRAFT_898773 [Armillaria solidipes]|uniref:Helitron helicase-like domain-containing protein n=1 Tax=Armillaria solidipes TaxID=1076256 RepID=A0A2H3AM00_9AGAR|nr:hypothetical protein ARMSODRAFT_898773 [Armillaria solidipes]